jgi:peptidoglycan/LPS O-acetylase OafA/YrhL
VARGRSTWAHDSLRRMRVTAFLELPFFGQFWVAMVTHAPLSDLNLCGRTASKLLHSSPFMWNRHYPLGRILSAKHLPALDGLRMVAVFMVVLYHGGWAWMPADLGVSVFFVLSGFLITWLLMQEHQRTATISLRAFYLRRVFRLLPAYYVYLGIALAIHFGRHHGRTDIVLPSLLYFANYFNAFNGHPESPISHTWSLAVEEQFYAFWPLAFLVLAARRRSAVQIFLLAAIPLVALWRAYLFLVVRTGTPYVYNAFDTRFDNIAVGCLAALLTKNDWFLQAAARISRHWFLPLIPIGLLGLTHTLLPEDCHYSFGFTLYALLIAVAIVQILQLSDHPAWSWLNHRFPRYLGVISYPIYLYHGLATSLARKASRSSPAIVMLLAVVLCILAGSISYYVVERPFLRLRTRLAHRGP